MSRTAIPPILPILIGRIAAAVPSRARATFIELLIGAVVTKGGHVTDAILAVGLSRAWTTYYWLLERGRWSWLSVWRALLGGLEGLFAPPVWHVVIDDAVGERISAKAPGSLIHHNHSAKPNRPRFLRGQGWLCLAAVVERGWKVGAVPLMLRLVRRGTQRGKLTSARFLLRLLGPRLGRVRVLLDAWFMRARLIEAALADGHTVIGRARRDLALYAVPRPPRRRRRGRPRKYGPRMTRARIEALPVHRSARVLYGKLEVVRYRIWSKTPGTQVQHRLIEATARWRNGGNAGFSRAPSSAVPPTFHNLPGVFDHVQHPEPSSPPTGRRHPSGRSWRRQGHARRAGVGHHRRPVRPRRWCWRQLSGYRSDRQSRGGACPNVGRGRDRPPPSRSCASSAGIARARRARTGQFGNPLHAQSIHSHVP